MKKKVKNAPGAKVEEKTQGVHFNNVRVHEPDAHKLRITVWADCPVDVYNAISALRNPRVKVAQGEVPIKICDGVWSILCELK